MHPDIEEQERLRELFGYGGAGEAVPEVGGPGRHESAVSVAWRQQEKAPGRRGYDWQESHASPLQTRGERDGR